jgi:mannose/fructose/N-acetylgalactosamine-specific phosphotransferase system component IID
LARSLLLQGSWNYRTMVGTGMGFALLPVLRRLHERGPALDEAVARQSAPFNAHPYLAELALGGLVRLETDGADAETIRRFRSAVGAPLGALGDRVVWAIWLPLTALLALVVFELGLPAWAAAVVFLLTYNTVHLALRWWGFHAGLDEGTQVAARLRTLGLVQKARRAEAYLVVLAGLLAGLLLTGPGGFGGAPWPWRAGAGGALVAGLLLGARAWRPTALLVVLAVAVLLLPQLLPGLVPGLVPESLP